MRTHTPSIIQSTSSIFFLLQFHLIASDKSLPIVANLISSYQVSLASRVFKHYTSMYEMTMIIISEVEMRRRDRSEIIVWFFLMAEEFTDKHRHFSTNLCFTSARKKHDDTALNRSSALSLSLDPTRNHFRRRI